MTKQARKSPSKAPKGKPAKRKPAKRKPAKRTVKRAQVPGELCGAKKGELVCTLHASHVGTHWDGNVAKSFGPAVRKNPAPKPKAKAPAKRAKVRNPQASVAAMGIRGRAGEVAVACDALRPWPVFAPRDGSKRRFAYVPWLARYYGLSPSVLVRVLREWEAAGLAALLVDDDRARVMAAGDKALCPVVAGGGLVVWAVFGE